MGTVYRETYTKPLPPNAEVFVRDGERFARWTDRRGRKHTAKVTTPTDGEYAGADRVLVEARTFTAKYRDGTGRVRKVATGCRTADAATILLAELEKRAERVRCGTLTAAEASTLDHQATPIAEHVAAYLEHLSTKRGKGGKPRVNATYLSNVRYRLTHVVAACGFSRLRDLNREAVERWAAKAESDGMGARTINAHLAAMTAFGTWCVDTRRLATNPAARLRKLDERADRRHERRALTADELRRLLVAARLRPLAEYGRPVAKRPEAVGRENRRSRRTWTRAPLTLDALEAAAARAREALAGRPDFITKLERRGRERALIYKALVLTGLRKGELASLTVGQLDLDGPQPYVALAAADAKSGHAAEIPLRADLVADLRAWLAERLDAARAAARAKGLPLPARLPDDVPLFNVPADLVRAFDRDLQVAGIPKRDDRGRVVDIHALRHTFGTHLSKGGVAPRVAQAAMRHSTIELTMNTYTDPRLLDVAGALDVLPDLPIDGRPDAERMLATGTNDGATVGLGLPEPVFPEENSRGGGERLYQKSTAEAENRGPEPAAAETCAPRKLVPTLVPTFGQTCADMSQDAQNRDDRPSDGIAVTAHHDAGCVSMSAAAQLRALGLEPRTCGLKGRKHRTEVTQRQDLTNAPTNACTNACTGTPEIEHGGPAEEAPATAVNAASAADAGGAGEHFAAALAMIATLPLTDAEKAEAVRRLLADLTAKGKP